MEKDENGAIWYKGNLHTHTTRSDGRKSPEEVMALYRDHGYDFLALTDHWIPSEEGERDGLPRPATDFLSSAAGGHRRR